MLRTLAARLERLEQQARAGGGIVVFITAEGKTWRASDPAEAPITGAELERIKREAMHTTFDIDRADDP